MRKLNFDHRLHWALIASVIVITLLTGCSKDEGGTDLFGPGPDNDTRYWTIMVYMDDMIQGLQFGLDNGVHLFSLSGGWAQGSDAVRSANRFNAELLLSIDVPWICAAGNGDNYGGHFAAPTDIASPGDCPGPWFAPNGGATAVVSVGASLSNNAMWAYSSYGPTAWDMDNPHGDTDYHDYPWPPGLMKHGNRPDPLTLFTRKRSVFRGRAGQYPGCSGTTSHG